MKSAQSNLVIAFWLLVAGLFAADLWLLQAYTPTEVTMGPIQKIFYLHLPVAICTFIACLITFIASLGYLWQRRTVLDDLAWASARVAVQLCAVVIVTGMIWGKSAWGVWWTWSPRLTFSLILFLLYCVYLILRSSVEGRQRRAMVAAVYGIIAFLDVPLVYLSTKFLTDIHPSSIHLEKSMQLTLLAFAAPVLLMTGGLICTRFRLNRLRTRLSEQAEQSSRGFDVIWPLPGNVVKA